MKALLLLLAGVFAFGAQIHLLTEYNPPWNYQQNGTVTGIAAKAVKAIAKEAGDTYTLRILPWNRAYETALKKQNHAVFSTLRTKTREDKFYWIGPLYRETFSLYEHKDAPTGVTTLHEAKSVGLIDAGPEQNALHQLLRKKDFDNLSTLSKNLADTNALAQKQVDLIALGDISIQAQCEQKNLACSLFRPLPFTLTKQAYYLAFSKKTDPEIIRRWKKAYNRLKEKGKFKMIKNRFVKASR